MKSRLPSALRLANRKQLNMQNAGRFDSGMETPDPRMSTGCEGLDRIMEGGLPANRPYLIEGSPGTGKTTLALQFLLEGVRNGEPVLYVTLSETKEELTCAQAR